MEVGSLGDALGVAQKLASRGAGLYSHNFEHWAPLPMEIPSLQLQIATRILVDVLNSSDAGGTRTWMTNVIERETGCTVRLAEEEAELRALVRFADVESDRGMAETVSLEDGDLWHHARFLERRQASRTPLTNLEVYLYLARAYENTTASDDCELVQLPVGNQEGWPAGAAVVFRWADPEAEPHHMTTEMLVAGLTRPLTSFLSWSL